MKRAITLQDLAKLCDGSSVMFEIVYPSVDNHKVRRIYPHELISDNSASADLLKNLEEDSESYPSLITRTVQHIGHISNNVVQVILENKWDIPSLYPTFASLCNFIYNLSDSAPKDDVGWSRLLSSDEWNEFLHSNVYLQINQHRIDTVYTVKYILESNDHFIRLMLDSNITCISRMSDKTYLITLENSWYVPIDED